MATTETKGRPLRLLAEDDDDLSVISAALQDAVARIGDIQFERQGKRLTLAVCRTRHEADTEGKERVRAGVQLGSVLKVRTRNLRQNAPDAVLQLLAITFEPVEPPGGVVTFAFADGGDLAAEVECIDAALADLSIPGAPTWARASGLPGSSSPIPQRMGEGDREAVEGALTGRGPSRFGFADWPPHLRWSPSPRLYGRGRLKSGSSRRVSASVVFLHNPLMNRLARHWTLVALVVSAGALAVAHGFETFGHLSPCELCLRAREVWWVALAIAAGGVVAERMRPETRHAAVALLDLGLPHRRGRSRSTTRGRSGSSGRGRRAAAAAARPVSLSDIQGLMKGGSKAPSCEKPAWVFAGLSMAGWDAVLFADDDAGQPRGP